MNGNDKGVKNFFFSETIELIRKLKIFFRWKPWENGAKEYFPIIKQLTILKY